ncbi:MAG: NAD(P)H-hydrate dehydratase [Psychrobacter sp.]
MKIHHHLSSVKSLALYNSDQVYAIEQSWFAAGYDSFGLMKQAAWQMAQCIGQIYEPKQLAAQPITDSKMYRKNTGQQSASIWVGKGNNGGDGWLLAYYLQQMGWQVQVTTVGFTSYELEIGSDNDERKIVSDAKKAQHIAQAANCSYLRFEDNCGSQEESPAATWQADVYIDALFGIGLDRAPQGIYSKAISTFNELSNHSQTCAISVDTPSGLVASTGEVYDRVAIQADMTLCLIARKFGLHTKDGLDYSGKIIDIPLIPHPMNDIAFMPVAKLVTAAHRLHSRWQNSHKGSYGHVLTIGGNRVDGSQGMGGAAILSASSAMATGAGKITVACHEAFHGALLTSLPDAMTINLQDVRGVKQLIQDASIIVIGMGLGRDPQSKDLFISYIQASIEAGKPIVIDADGLYHLSSLQKESHELIDELRHHSAKYQVCLTPHSGEAARLLDMEISDIEKNRLAAIEQCAEIYGGDWILKGAGSLVLEQCLVQKQVYVCGVGNAGMATAGMGDVLSGVIAGLMAQQELTVESRSLLQAVLIHGQAGDALVHQTARENGGFLMGQRGLQAQDMPAAIRHVMQLLISE